jgi:hypothetical protein
MGETRNNKLLLVIARRAKLKGSDNNRRSVAINRLCVTILTTLMHKFPMVNNEMNLACQLLLIGIPPSIEDGSSNPEIPAGFVGIADLIGMLKHSKFALTVAFFVRHENFLHPRSGNLQEVSREYGHIYTHMRGVNLSFQQFPDEPSHSPTQPEHRESATIS